MVLNQTPQIRAASDFLGMLRSRFELVYSECISNKDNSVGVILWLAHQSL